MKDGYKEIKIGGGNKRVEFEDDITLETPQIEVEDLEDIVVEKPVEKVEEKPKEDVKPVVEKKPESRSQKRIKQVLSQRDEAIAKLEAERAAREALEKKLAETTKSSKSTLKSELEQKIKILAAQMTEAIKAGDAEATVAIQGMLNDAQWEYKDLSKEIATTPEFKTEPPKTAPNNTVSDRALEWIEEHAEFKTDPRFRSDAILINNQLLREGFDVNHDDFYEELDMRLSRHYPELFGIEEKNSVESNHTKISSVDDGKEDEHTDAKAKAVEKPSTSKVRTAEQTVSGSSRPSASNVQSKKKYSVDLSPADIAQADRWGLSLEQMARRIAHNEANRRADGYVPINIGSK